MVYFKVLTTHANIFLLDYQVEEGEFLGVMASTGAGKSTLLYAMAGVIPHYHRGQISGEVLVRGKKTTDCTLAELSQMVGLVMEDPEAQLFNLIIIRPPKGTIYLKGVDLTRMNSREICKIVGYVFQGDSLGRCGVWPPEPEVST